MTTSQISLICEVIACALAAATSGALVLFQRHRRLPFLLGVGFTFGAMLAAVLITVTFLTVSWKCGVVFFSSMASNPAFAKTVCPSADILEQVFNGATAVTTIFTGIAAYMAAKVFEPKEIAGEEGYPPRYWTASAFGLGFGAVFIALKFLL